MAALDFPASPTVGQQYAAPNGVTYQWDGAAWVVTGGPPATPTGPAGGDLTGTYPNPTVAPLKVTTAKLAVLASTPNVQSVETTVPQDTMASTTEQTLCTISMTTRGGAVLVIFSFNGRMYATDDTNIVVRIYYDSTLATSANLRGSGPNVTMPMSATIAYAFNNLPAGAHSFTGRWIQTSGTQHPPMSNAHLTVVELA